ncbi:MAG: hypothetical protein AB7P40_16015 [Chloroflexota bacterium]
MAREYRLDISIEFDRTFARGNDLDVFQALLHAHAPSWCMGLQVWRHYHFKTPVNVSIPGDLARVLRTIALADTERRARHWQSSPLLPYVTPDRVTGSEELRGSNPSLILVTDIDDFVLKPIGDIWGWGNSIAIQICRARVEGMPAARWAYDMFLAICEALAPAHAYANMWDEYDAKNMYREHGHVHAIGVDRSAALCGLYWLNYFGRPYRDLIGRDRLMTAPAHELREIGDGVLIGLAEDPRAWNTPEYRQCERAVIDHLGQQYFFDRNDPERETIAPDFGVPKLPPATMARYLTAVRQGKGWSWQMVDAPE